MSSMAYEDIENDKMEVDEKKFEDNFRALPSLKELNEGFKIGPRFPQAQIDWDKMIKKLSEREEYDSTWLKTGLGERPGFFYLFLFSRFKILNFGLRPNFEWQFGISRTDFETFIFILFKL